MRRPYSPRAGPYFQIEPAALLTTGAHACNLAMRQGNPQQPGAARAISILGKSMSIRRFSMLGCWLCLAFLSSGCASIVEGTDQSVTVQTSPSGASCELKRDGTVIGVVNPTPGTITVDKSKNDIAVICKKDGYQDGSGAFSSEFQGMTFGNLLFGGIIGVAVDASSGAMHEYPASVTVVMAPNSFANSAER